MAQWQSGVIEQHCRWSEQLHSLRIVTAPVTFVAGQYTRLGLQVGDTLVARPYSFVNPPSDPVLEFYFNTVPQGPLSNRLAALNSGDSIKVSTTVTGFMVLDEVPAGRDLWMLATGTAIGPFLSILRTEPLWQRFERVMLVHAVRHWRDLNYSFLLDQLATEHSGQFSWLPMISRDPFDKVVRPESLSLEAANAAIAGRIPAAIKDGRLEQQFGLTLNAVHSRLMVCGNPAMVKDSLAILKQRGLAKNLRRSPGQVTVERYW